MPRHTTVLITLLLCLFFNCGCTHSLAKYEPFSLYVGQDVRLLRGLNVWEKGSAFNKSYRLGDLPTYRRSPNLIGVLPVERVLKIVDVRCRYTFKGTRGFFAVLRFEGPPGKGEILAKYNWGYSGSLRKPPWQLVDTSIADPFADLQDDDELYVGWEGKSYGEDARK